jgi:hypothetical protein
MAELDPYLQEKLRQRAKVRKAKTLGDVAASLKVGQRYDPTKPWQDLKRKLEAAQPWATGLSQSEQYYFGQEYDARELARKQAHERLLKKVDVGIERARLDQNAQLTQIMTDFKSLLELKEETENDLNLQRYGPGGNPAVAAERDRRIEQADGSGVSARAESMDLAEAEGMVLATDPDVQAVKAYMTSEGVRKDESDPNAPSVEEVNLILQQQGIEPGGTTEEKFDKLVKSKAKQAKAEYAGFLNSPITAAAGVAAAAPEVEGAPKSTMAEGVEKLTMALDQQSEIPGDRAAAIERAASSMNPPLSAAGLIDALAKSQNPKHVAAAKEAAKELDARDIKTEELSKTYREVIPQKRDALSAYARRAGLDGALAELEAMENEYLQYLEDTGQSRRITDAEEYLEAAAAEGEVEEEGKGGAPISERERNFYNIISETQGYAPEVMGRMLKAIEDYEDLPTAQSLKAQVVGSQQFADFMKQRNITDRDIAFRLMNREARAARAADRRKSREEIIRQSREGRISRKDAEEVLQGQVEPTQPQPPKIDTADPTRFGLTSPEDAKKR